MGLGKRDFIFYFYLNGDFIKDNKNIGHRKWYQEEFYFATLLRT